MAALTLLFNLCVCSGLRQLFLILTLFFINLPLASSEHLLLASRNSNVRPKVWLWNVGEYPNPQKMPRACERYQKSFVCDPDEIISMEEANTLDTLIETAKHETPCLCNICNSTESGITIGVALLKNIYLDFHASKPEQIQTFAEKLRRNWTLGRCDDDILIFVLTGDLQIYIDTGNTISNLLSKEITNRIFLENRHHFTNGDYYQGLKLLIQSYSNATITEALYRSPRSTNQSSLNLIIGLTVTFVLLVALLGGLAFWWTKLKRGKESNRRFSWETCSSLKRADIKGPYVSVRTSDYQMPPMIEKRREGPLECLNEEEEIEIEQMSEEENRDSGNLCENENISLDLEEENKIHETENKNEENNTEGEDEEYFMPRNRSQTQRLAFPENNGNIENTNL